MEPTKNNKHLDALVKELSEQLTQGKPLTGQDGVFTPLLKRVIEASLEGEMDAPLQAEKGSGSNRRNGRGTKTKGAFSSENAIVKQIYLATINAQTKWSGTIFGWSSVRRDLVDYFDDRFLTPHTL